MPSRIKNSPSKKSPKKSKISKTTSLKLNKSVSVTPQLYSEFDFESTMRTKSRGPLSPSMNLEERNSFSSLIGYIDPLGVFKLNLSSIGIELLNGSLTEDKGFFDKMSFESSLKDWHSDTKLAFELHKSIFKGVLFCKKSKGLRLLHSKILSWSYFDERVEY